MPRRPDLGRTALALALAGLALTPLAARADSSSRSLHTIAIAEDERRADGTLQRFLKDPDPRVRQRAALALGRLQDSTTVRDLRPLLGDPDVEVKREVVFALGQIGHRSARPALEALLVPGDEETEDLAIEALGKLGDHAATPRLLPLLDDPSPRLRGEVGVALWRLADSTAIDALIAHRTDPDPEVRWRLLYALEKVVAPDRIVLPVALHVDDSEWRVRAQAVRTLGRQKSTRATAYVLQKLDDPEVPVVVNAIRALQQIADSTSGAALPALIHALGHFHPYVRVTAATALGDAFAWRAADSLQARAALDTLAARTADADAATRGACARALLRRQGKAAWATVAPLLDDRSLYTRTAVLGALGALPAASVAPVLLERLAPGHALFERMTAADALGELAGGPGLAELRAGLADSALLVVASCAAALAARHDSASVPALERAYAARAGDADADARLSIRDALRDLAGRARADSVERAHPARNAGPTRYADDFEHPPAVHGAVLHTSAGDIEWSFYSAEAPQTVRNFVTLAARGYFDGLALHRVVPNFVIQDGDPTGTGSGGPGYTIRCEYNRLRYEAGMVGMALSGKDTGGSQWFITHSPQLHLDGRYTIFAHVVRGMDVVGRLVQGDRVFKVELLR
jgi:cyclophilin family peptidyl-prolyl cis-trans isomerase/HEAT repeat protein